MANAFIVAPLVPASSTSLGTLQAGSAANLFNDYGGLVCQMATDYLGTHLAGIHIDFGADTSFDTLLVFGVELFGAGFDPSIQLQWATAAFGDFPGGAASGTDGSGLAYAGGAAMTSGKGVSLWTGAAPITARYVQLYWLGASSSNVVRAARIVIGRRIQLGRNFSMGGSNGVKDLGSADFSRRGVLNRAPGAILRTRGVTFSNVQKDELEASMLPLIEKIGNTRMVALVTDPSVDAQRQNRCYFGPLVGDLSAAQRNVRAWEIKLNLVSIF